MLTFLCPGEERGMPAGMIEGERDDQAAYESNLSKGQRVEGFGLLPNFGARTCSSFVFSSCRSPMFAFVCLFLLLFFGTNKSVEHMHIQSEMFVTFSSFVMSCLGTVSNESHVFQPLRIKLYNQLT